MKILDFVKKVQEMYPATYEKSGNGEIKHCNVEANISFDEKRKRFHVSFFINKEHYGFRVEDRDDREKQLETSLDEGIKKLTTTA